ncbi:MAG: diguanylate cyclase [Spirochaetales bacterium]|nr:diguanylate cyclase [Spirochaetales bacterium]
MAKKKHKKSLTIGLQINQSGSGYSFCVFQGASERARERDVNLIVYPGYNLNFPYGNLARNNVIYNFINGNNIDGCIFTTGTLLNYVSDDEFLRFFRQYDALPCISLGVEIKDRPSILIDNRTGMHELVTHFIREHGYKRICFLKGPDHNPEADIRFRAFEEAMRDNGLPVLPDLILQGDFSMRSAEVVTQKLLNDKRVEFEAIIAANDDMAYASMNILVRNGIRVPDEVAVGGFDNIEMAQYSNVPISTVNQPLYEMGRMGVDYLLDLIDGRELPHKTYLSTKAVIRYSCGCLPKTGLVIKPDDGKISAGPDMEKIIREAGMDLDLPGKKEKQILIHLKSQADLLLQILAGKHDWKDIQRTFLESMNRIVQAVCDAGCDLEIWHVLLARLFSGVISAAGDPDAVNKMLLVYSGAERILSEKIKMEHAQNRLKGFMRLRDLRTIFEGMNSITCGDEMFARLSEHLPLLNVRHCFLVLYENEVPYNTGDIFIIPRSARLVMALIDGEKREIPDDLQKFNPADEIIPKSLLPVKECFALHAYPVFFSNTQFGYILYERDRHDGFLYEFLNSLVASLLSGARQFKALQEAELKSERLLKQLKESNERLHSLDQLKNDFIANITHDFRSLLMIILNTSELGIKYDAGAPEAVRQRYNTISNASIKLKDTIDKLLDLARMDSKGIKLNVKHMDIRAFISEIVDFYRSTVLWTKIKIDKKIPDSVPDDFYTDREKLEEILINVISNSLKFINPEDGRITIELTVENRKIRIKVEDNGVGIPEEKLERIFERFEQSESGMKSMYKGSGIGLAFSKQLAGYLKGSIWAESEGVNKGARFILELPVGKDRFNREDFSNQDLEDGEEGRKRDYVSRLVNMEIREKLESGKVTVFINDPNGENEFDPYKGIILIIEDNSFIRNIELEYLTMNGYKNFVIAHNGRQGVEAAYKFRPDLILTDFNMPEMRGDELQDELSKNPDFANIPFIFLSAVSNANIIVERKKKGAVAYLKKPIEMNDFLATIGSSMKHYMGFKRTYKKANIDELTGLYNKAHMDANLLEKISLRTLRHLSIIFMDLDLFKKLNDTYGHQVGDKVLAATGVQIKAVLRNYDSAGRYGGEEFLIALPETNMKNALIVADKLRRIIGSTPVENDGKTLFVTASFGVSSLIDNEGEIIDAGKIKSLASLYEVSNDDNPDWEMINAEKRKILRLLIQFADRALYAAKSTQCRSCGYSSIDNDDFKDGLCPKCGSNEISVGRNRVVAYQGDSTPGSS